jgi:hypothetical protein
MLPQVYSLSLQDDIVFVLACVQDDVTYFTHRKPSNMLSVWPERRVYTKSVSLKWGKFIHIIQNCYIFIRTHARMHARINECTNMQTDARMDAHARRHARLHTHASTHERTIKRTHALTHARTQTCKNTHMSYTYTCFCFRFALQPVITEPMWRRTAFTTW